MKKFTLDGFEINGLVWASGNLVFANGKYGFAATQGDYGDYWHRNMQGKIFTNPFSSTGTGRGVGSLSNDICQQVGSAWRVPTKKDVDKLVAYPSWYNNPNRYLGTYTISSVNAKGVKEVHTVEGVYFGVNAQPTLLKQDNYLFLPFAGAYNTLNATDMGRAGFYWHTGLGTNNEGTNFQLGNSYFSENNNGGLDDQRANTIRCVRDVG